MQSSANPGRSTSKYRISDWYFDAELHQLQRGEKQIRLEPRVAQLLTCLMTNPGSPVSREQLLETVWPATVVGDEALNNAVNKLRRAFEDDRHRPRFIETLPKIGYRLIAPVTTVADPGETHAESTPNPVTRSAANGSILVLVIVLGIALASALSWFFLLPGRDKNTGGLEEPGERSIAVLPFENLNHDPAQDYFADGMSDDLITELSRVPGLLVISRSSSYALRDKRDDIRDLARTLNANFIIEGSVRREAEKSASMRSWSTHRAAIKYGRRDSTVRPAKFSRCRIKLPGRSLLRSNRNRDQCRPYYLPFRARTADCFTMQLCRLRGWQGTLLARSPESNRYFRPSLPCPGGPCRSRAPLPTALAAGKFRLAAIPYCLWRPRRPILPAGIRPKPATRGRIAGIVTGFRPCRLVRTSGSRLEPHHTLFEYC